MEAGARKKSLLEAGLSARGASMRWKVQMKESRRARDEHHSQSADEAWRSSALREFVQALESEPGGGVLHGESSERFMALAKSARDEQLELRRQVAELGAQVEVTSKEREHFRRLLDDCAETIAGLTRDVEKSNADALESEERAISATRRLNDARKASAEEVGALARAVHTEDDDRLVMDVNRTLARAGVGDLRSLAAFGNLVALRERAERAEEELGSMARRVAALEEDHYDLEHDCERAEKESKRWQSISERLEQVKDELEVKARESEAEAHEWRRRAIQLEGDLDRAQNAIGSMSTSLGSSRKDLRLQMDDLMIALKASVIVLDARGIKFIDRYVKMLTGKHTGKDKAGHFKTAHSVIKRTVIQYVGERRPGKSWGVVDDDKFLKTVPPHEYKNLYQSLRELVIAYDWMSDADKNQLQTAHETVVNSRTLLSLARFLRQKLIARRLQASAGSVRLTKAANAVRATMRSKLLMSALGTGAVSPPPDGPRAHEERTRRSRSAEPPGGGRSGRSPPRRDGGSVSQGSVWGSLVSETKRERTPPKRDAWGGLVGTAAARGLKSLDSASSIKGLETAALAFGSSSVDHSVSSPGTPPLGSWSGDTSAIDELDGF